ncbi:hypothetical protein EZY14_007485 [Kordia sp. TARA_039_SRF]|nr:hypothetical protein EZY14_007485 [Kordia sp. TARA_039_SRF]
MLDKVELIKKKAEELGNNLDFWMKKLGNKTGINEQFLPWIKKKYPNQIGSLNYESQKKYRRFLREEIKNMANGAIENKAFNFHELPQVLNSQRFIEYAEKYILDKEIEKKNQLTEVKYWYLYFLEIGTIQEKCPKLGRGVLVMHNKKHVTLKIPDNDPINDYEGEFSQLNSHVGFFDLDTLEKDENNKPRIIKKLHVKIYFGTLEDEIIIGSYNTYDKRIYTGALVLERIKDESLLNNEEKLNQKVMFLSRRENSIEFFDNVHISIKSYLSSKLKNIRQAPKTIVQNKAGLESFVESEFEKEPSINDIENRFLELEKPIAFIAYPQKSLKDREDNIEIKNFITAIPSKIEAWFNKEIDVFTEGSFEADPARTRPLKTLKFLEKSRYFIILLPETDRISYSIIQLGWALKSSKYILLISEKETISQRLEKLTYVNSNFLIENISFESEKDREKILTVIYNFIEAKLD